ncbi:unnamed protein product [Mytilus coruscus]|uniref:RING-type domain-containing protein n=1 Tax=Mytilus coruscus TaxID=42192 RepID=A0A6J8BEM6_MYTCO|nr:unnamed protein product [Mytilus coruscus]
MSRPRINSHRISSSVESPREKNRKWSIWNVSLFLDGAEDLVQKRENFMDFRSLKSSHVSSVIIKEVMKLHPSLYDYTYRSDVEFRIIIELGELGRTSVPLISKLFDAISGQLLVERFLKLVFIDNKTRRPVNNPEWYLNKNSHIQGVPYELLKMPLPEQPPEVFEYRTVVRYSDLDSNYHANYSLYIKSCIDCVTTASIDKKLVHFSGDMCWYPDFHRKQTDDWESNKYKPVVILGGSDCAICLKQKDSRSEPIVTLFCNHEFHKNCARGWLLNSEKERCCLCRSSISSFTKSELTDAKKEEKSFIQTYPNTSVSNTGQCIIC